jgi:hypothetical protein
LGSEWEISAFIKGAKIRRYNRGGINRKTKTKKEAFQHLKAFFDSEV